MLLHLCLCHPVVAPVQHADPGVFSVVESGFVSNEKVVWWLWLHSTMFEAWRRSCLTQTEISVDHLSKRQSSLATWAALVQSDRLSRLPSSSPYGHGRGQEVASLLQPLLCNFVSYFYNVCT